MCSKGFTLVELMIVVAIIGILASIAIPSYQRYMVKAKISGVVTTAKGYMRLVEENISDSSRCFGRNSDGTAGNQYQITTPDFINNPTSASINLVWRGDTFVPGINGNGCMVVVRGNPNVFNANFQLWYLSTSITDLSTSSGAVIQWTCYFELFDTAANNARMLPAMPSNCTNRAGNF